MSTLPDELTAELIALPPASYGEAWETANALRKKYLDKLVVAVVASTADRGLHFSIASEINDRVDR